MEIKKFKVDVIFHKVENGIVEQVKIGNDVYQLMKKEQTSVLVEKKEQIIPEPEVEYGANRGKKVDTFQGTAIYENTLNDVEQLIAKGEGDTINLRKIIKKYNPNYKGPTVYSQATVYRNYVYSKKGRKQKTDRGKKLGVMKNNNIYENILSDIITAVNEGRKYPELERIIAQYYPGCTELTYHTYVNMYKRWHKEHTLSESKIGKIIARLGGNTIHEKIFADISQGIDEGMGNEDLLKIIKGYHPDAKSTSHYTYLRAYQRYKKEIESGKKQPEIILQKERNKIGIICDILTIVKEVNGIHKSQLCFKAKMDPENLPTYLDFLLGKGFLRKDGDNRYYITENGKNLLRDSIGLREL